MGAQLQYLSPKQASYEQRIRVRDITPRLKELIQWSEVTVKKWLPCLRFSLNHQTYQINFVIDA